MLFPARLAPVIVSRLLSVHPVADRLRLPGTALQIVSKDPNKKPGLYFPRFYSIGFPSLSVQVIDTHPPKAAAMACNSFIVHPSRLNLFEKFWRLCPVAAARSESDTPARLANRRICSLVVNSIAVYPLARKGTPFPAMCQIILKKLIQCVKSY